jgi:isocitrate dehydrogenase
VGLLAGACGSVTWLCPQGYKSLNVSIRKTLGLYANVRPVMSLTPFVGGKEGVDVVCVRENEEDTYAGIEHQQTPEVVQCLKLVSRPGCERLLRYAFDYAVANERKRVTVFHKANIMKLTDGMFLDVARQLYEAEYKGRFALDDIIVDIGTALIADRPNTFDVVTMPNLYGDIVSDVLAQVTGSVGLGSSANIGKHVSMFEAIHGSAPDIAGKNVANPSGMLLAAVQMLHHLNHAGTAETIQNAWLRTIEDGVHTGDIYNPKLSKERATTSLFADAVIARLGQKPQHLAPARLGNSVVRTEMSDLTTMPTYKRDLHGVDVFVYWPHKDADALAESILGATKEVSDLKLSLITNRGVKVWPQGMPETTKTDHWRCRFRAVSGGAVDAETVLGAISGVSRGAAEVIKTENLFLYDGQPGFSLGQGE